MEEEDPEPESGPDLSAPRTFICPMVNKVTRKSNLKLNSSYCRTSCEHFSRVLGNDQRIFKVGGDGPESYAQNLSNVIMSVHRTVGRAFSDEMYREEPSLLISGILEVCLRFFDPDKDQMFYFMFHERESLMSDIRQKLISNLEKSLGWYRKTLDIRKNFHKVDRTSELFPIGNSLVLTITIVTALLIGATFGVIHLDTLRSALSANNEAFRKKVEADILSRIL